MLTDTNYDCISHFPAEYVRDTDALDVQLAIAMVQADAVRTLDPLVDFFGEFLSSCY